MKLFVMENLIVFNRRAEKYSVGVLCLQYIVVKFGPTLKRMTWADGKCFFNINLNSVLTLSISSFEADTTKLSSDATAKRQTRAVWPFNVIQHWSVTRSQIFNDWSFEPDTIRRPSCSAATHLTNPPWPLRVAQFFVLRSQILIVLSSEPDMKLPSSHDITRQRTGPVWPL